MGTDTPVAVLSQRPRMLYDYFQQLFAQVTNPPLDAIREEVVTSLRGTVGPEGDLLNPDAESCRQIVLSQPILRNAELSKLICVDPDHEIRGHKHGMRAAVIRCLYPVNRGGQGLKEALDNVRAKVSAAIRDGARIIVLSDRESDESMAPIPSLLTVSAVHHHLVRDRTRTKVGLVVEAGDAREVHHMACLVGFGAAAINPYMAFESIEDMVDRGVDHRHQQRQGQGQLRQGRGQGRAEGDVQDGHLDAGVLHRRAAVPGHRHLPAGARRVLHRADLCRRRHRPRRHRRRRRHPACAGLPGPARRVGAPRARGRRRVPVAPRGRVPPVQPGHGVQAAALDPHRAVLDLQGVHPAGRRPERADGIAARPAEVPRRCA